MDSSDFNRLISARDTDETLAEASDFFSRVSKGASYIVGLSTLVGVGIAFDEHSVDTALVSGVAGVTAYGLRCASKGLSRYSCVKRADVIIDEEAINARMGFDSDNYMR